MDDGPQMQPYAVVVDDNAVILLHVADVLTDGGFSVFSASSSDEAMGWLADHGDDIALLVANADIPGEMNGFALSQYVAKWWPAVATVVMSGRFTPEGHDIPADSLFLPKPFTSAELLHAVRAVLETRRMTTPPSA